MNSKIKAVFYIAKILFFLYINYEKCRIIVYNFIRIAIIAM